MVRRADIVRLLCALQLGRRTEEITAKGGSKRFLSTGCVSHSSLHWGREKRPRKRERGGKEKRSLRISGFFSVST